MVQRILLSWVIGSLIIFLKPRSYDYGYIFKSIKFCGCGSWKLHVQRWVVRLDSRGFWQEVLNVPHNNLCQKWLLKFKLSVLIYPATFSKYSFVEKFKVITAINNDFIFDDFFLTSIRNFKIFTTSNKTVLGFKIIDLNADSYIKWRMSVWNQKILLFNI